MFFNLKKIVMWLITSCSALFITIFCLANRSSVEIDIWPFPIKQSVPLFVLILTCIGVGILWGGFSTWLSAGPSRKKNREAKRMAVVANLAARNAEERCSRLEQSLQDLSTQERPGQKQVQASPL